MGLPFGPPTFALFLAITRRSVGSSPHFENKKSFQEEYFLKAFYTGNGIIYFPFKVLLTSKTIGMVFYRQFETI
jgi:hypothetical protein